MHQPVGRAAHCRRYPHRDPNGGGGGWCAHSCAAGILALLLWSVGTGPFLDGVRAIDGWSLAAAFGIGAVTIGCCAWRWSLVAAGLGVPMRMREAFAAYYRSQFLNTTLPGGVAGDVHRAVRHGLDIGDVGLGVRAVVLERVAGQAALAVIALVVLPCCRRRYGRDLPLATVVVVAAGLGAALVLWALVRGRSARWVRVLRAEWAQIRNGSAGAPYRGGHHVRIGRGGRRAIWRRSCSPPERQARPRRCGCCCR